MIQLIPTEPFKTSSAWRCFKTNSSTWPRLQGVAADFIVGKVVVWDIWCQMCRCIGLYWRVSSCAWCTTSLITWIIHLLIACLIGCLIDKLMDWLAGWVSKRVLQMLSTGNTTQQTKNYQNLLHVTCYDNGLENTVANLRRTSPEPFNSGLQRTDTVEWLNRGDWVAGQGFVVLWWTCLFCQVKVVVYITLYIYICLKYILYHTIPNQTRPFNCTTLHYITLHYMQ